MFSFAHYMYKHIFLLLVSFISFSHLVSAQIKSTDIVFVSKSVDFGTIYVENGPVTAKYKFTNNGDSEFIINKVEAACGCTHSRSSKDTIQPDESAEISAVFDPKGMLGEAKKWVNVYGRMDDSYQIDLEFTAKIESYVNRNDGAYYRGQYGYLLVDKTRFFWGDRYLNKPFSDTVILTNDGYNDITVKELLKNPYFLQSTNLPITIKPGESKPMYFFIDTRLIDTVGGYYDDFQISTNDKFFKLKSMSFGMNFKTDFNTWKRKDIKKAGHLELSTNKLDFGKVKSGAVKSTSISITNTGKSPITIKRVDTDCACAFLKLNNKTILPGESKMVVVKFDSLFKEGFQSKVITIYSNDPDAPVQTIIVRAEVL